MPPLLRRDVGERRSGELVVGPCDVGGRRRLAPRTRSSRPSGQQTDIDDGDVAGDVGEPPESGGRHRLEVGRAEADQRFERSADRGQMLAKSSSPIGQLRGEALVHAFEMGAGVGADRQPCAISRRVMICTVEPLQLVPLTWITGRRVADAHRRGESRVIGSMLGDVIGRSSRTTRDRRGTPARRRRASSWCGGAVGQEAAARAASPARLGWHERRVHLLPHGLSSMSTRPTSVRRGARTWWLSSTSSRIAAGHAHPCRAGSACSAKARDRGAELELDVFELERPLVLLHERVLVGEDPHQRVEVRLRTAPTAAAADELRDHPELDEVFGNTWANNRRGRARFGRNDAVGTRHPCDRCGSR